MRRGVLCVTITATYVIASQYALGDCMPGHNPDHDVCIAGDIFADFTTAVVPDENSVLWSGHDVTLVAPTQVEDVDCCCHGEGNYEDLVEDGFAFRWTILDAQGLIQTRNVGAECTFSSDRWTPGWYSIMLEVEDTPDALGASGDDNACTHTWPDWFEVRQPALVRYTQNGVKAFTQGDTYPPNYVMANNGWAFEYVWHSECCPQGCTGQGDEHAAHLQHLDEATKRERVTYDIIGDMPHEMSHYGINCWHDTRENPFVKGDAATTGLSVDFHTHPFLPETPGPDDLKYSHCFAEQVYQWAQSPPGEGGPADDDDSIAWYDLWVLRPNGTVLSSPYAWISYTLSLKVPLPLGDGRVVWGVPYEADTPFWTLTFRKYGVDFEWVYFADPDGD